MTVDPASLPWPLPSAVALRDRLFTVYGEPGRGYHNQLHLAEVLARLMELSEAGEPFQLDLVVVAAWFHDAVYEGGPDDEERSARWAEKALADSGLGPAMSDEVVRLVRVTSSHRPEPGDANGAALCDADLAILAAGPDRYAAYAAGVRAEYAHVDDRTFRVGRAAILMDLAAKPSLFHTAHARTHWEAPARANLARELASLRGELPRSAR